MTWIKKIFSPVTATLSFIQNHFKAMLFLLICFLIFAPGGAESVTSANLAKVYLNGPIMDATKLVDELETLRKEEKIKGVLLVVNSPGGAVAPSVEIALAVKRLATKKPLIAYAAGTMASGSYYASIWADKIIANPAASIGSIGVILQTFNIESLADKIGIAPQTVKAGRFKEAGTPFRAWSQEEKEELQTHVTDIYTMFVHDVAQARKLNLDKQSKFADARIFIAPKAIKAGLIDEIGSIIDAQEQLAAAANVVTPKWKEKERFEKFLETISEESGRFLSGRITQWSVY